MGREKRHRTALFSALKGIAALFSTMAPLMHLPADSEQEVALIPSICSIFICLVVDTDGEKFPGNTMEGIPGGGRTDLETYRATWGWMPAKTVLRDSSLMDTQLCGLEPLCGENGRSQCDRQSLLWTMMAMGACWARPVHRRHCCEGLHMQRAHLCMRMVTMILVLSHLFLVCIYDVHMSQCICGGQRPTWGAGPFLPPCWRQAFLLSTVFTRLAHLEASRASPVSISHLANGTLGPQKHTALHSPTAAFCMDSEVANSSLPLWSKPFTHWAIFSDYHLIFNIKNKDPWNVKQ